MKFPGLFILLSLIFLPQLVFAANVSVVYQEPETCLALLFIEADSIDDPNEALAKLQLKAENMHANMIYVIEFIPTEISMHQNLLPVAIHYKIKGQAYSC